METGRNKSDPSHLEKLKANATDCFGTENELLLTKLTNANLIDLRK